METTAHRIKKFRELRNYTQEFLASILGISQPAYAKIEQGKTKITLKRLREISEILKVEPLELLEGINDNRRINFDYFIGVAKNPNRDVVIVYEKLIKQLTAENERLIAENENLWNLIENRKV